MIAKKPLIAAVVRYKDEFASEGKYTIEEHDKIQQAYGTAGRIHEGDLRLGLRAVTVRRTRRP